MLTKQFLIRSAGDLRWGLHAGHQESVFMAARSRGLISLWHHGLLDSGRTWWHSQLCKSCVRPWKHG